VAKDGFAMPVSQSVKGAARRLLHPGETFDSEWEPPAPGVYQLRMISYAGNVACRRTVRVRRWRRPYVCAG
jgi:hypothetical protein